MKKLSTLAVATALFTAAFILCAYAASPFIYVGNTGEDTVSKIHISSNTEVARYAAWFTSGTNHWSTRTYANTSAGPAPSRTAIDAAGDAYVLDRFFAAHLPVLLKIAQSPTTPTSSSSTVLQLLDSNGDNHIGTTEITDKAIVWATEIGTPGAISSGGDDGAWGRALCIDTSGYLWVGMYNSHRYYKVDRNNGNVVAGPISTGSHTPYGCQVDSNGHLWSTDNANTLAEIDTTATNPPAATVFPPDTTGAQHYAIAVSNDCSSTPPKIKVYISDQAGNSFVVFDPQTSTFSFPPNTVPKLLMPSYAIAVDSQGNVISGGLTGRVMKIKPPGTVVWDTGVPSTPLNNLHGLIVDSNDDIWAVNCANNGQVIKHSGGSGASSLPVAIGALPYTYGNSAPPTCNSTATPTPTPTPTATPSGCAQVDGQARCLTNGEYSYTFNVSNNSGNSASQILLTPVQGSSFTLTPQLTDLSAPLQSGHSASLTTTIGNAKPGDKVCFFVSLMSEKAPCCIVQVCSTLPRCGVIETATPPPPTRQQRPLPPSRRGKRRP